ncbi:hypothetical protein ACFQ7F_35480 [Streptomyces sp. NPDC056486]|uniref:hypothetical protein n=1 Tax=Streptomyces sp. NPDC056486 TaxID=3345835 RepID=UPI00369B65C7
MPPVQHATILNSPAVPALVQDAVPPAEAAPKQTPRTSRSNASTPPPVPPVQRATKPVRLHTSPSTATATSSPLPVARLVAPSTPSRATPAPAMPLAPTRGGIGTGAGDPIVQRGFRSATRSATESLAAAAASTVATTLGRIRPGSHGRQEQESVEDDPLPFPPDRTTAAATSSATSSAPPPPEYTRVPEGTFDPKDLTDFQLDELAHRMIGRITRLVRTELRMDRERIGRLRDDRR